MKCGVLMATIPSAHTDSRFDVRRAAMSRYQIKVSETDISTIAAEGVSVLDACLEGGVALEYNCRSGECGECIATLVSGTVKERSEEHTSELKSLMRT